MVVDSPWWRRYRDLMMGGWKIKLGHVFEILLDTSCGVVSQVSQESGARQHHESSLHVTNARSCSKKRISKPQCWAHMVNKSNLLPWYDLNQGHCARKIIPRSSSGQFWEMKCCPLLMVISLMLGLQLLIKFLSRILHPQFFTETQIDTDYHRW